MTVFAMKEQLLRSAEQKEGQSVLTNTLRVLTWIAESTSKTVGVREIAKALSMQPSTVSRILKTLVKEGLVGQDPRDKGYKLGLELLRLGVLASQKLNLRTIAKPYMNELVQQTNEDAVLGVYDPNRQEMLRVEQVHSGHPLRYVIELDKWTEIYKGASGLAILAFLPKEEQNPILDLADSKSNAKQPWLKKEALEIELKNIKKLGYACTAGRRLQGAVSVSAPILDPNSYPLGDLIVTVPVTRWELHKEEDLGKLVKKYASIISSDLVGTRTIASK